MHRSEIESVATELNTTMPSSRIITRRNSRDPENSTQRVSASSQPAGGAVSLSTEKSERKLNREYHTC